MYTVIRLLESYRKTEAGGSSFAVVVWENFPMCWNSILTSNVTMISVRKTCVIFPIV